MERKEAALEEKREQILQAKGEVDRVMGELTEARQTITRLRSQLDTATVCLPIPRMWCIYFFSLSGGAASERDPAD